MFEQIFFEALLLFFSLNHHTEYQKPMYYFLGQLDKEKNKNIPRLYYSSHYILDDWERLADSDFLVSVFLLEKIVVQEYVPL